MHSNETKGLLLSVGVRFIQTPIFSAIRVIDGKAEIKVYETRYYPIRDEREASIFLMGKAMGNNLVFVLPNIEGGLTHRMDSGRDVIRYYETPMSADEKGEDIGKGVEIKVENKTEVKNNYKYLLIR